MKNGMKEKSNNWLIELFYKAATEPNKYRTFLSLVGPFVYLSFIGLIVYAAVRTDALIGFPKIIAYPLNVILAMPFLLPGVFLVIWCISLFLLAKGSPVPFNPPKHVVSNGPYALSRNPMLTGVILSVFGIGIWVQSLSLLCVYLPVFIILNYIELKKVEEPELIKRFGQEYIEYRKRTPMFFPWKRKKTGN